MSDQVFNAAQQEQAMREQIEQRMRLMEDSRKIAKQSEDRQRRYEIAKAVLAGLAANPGLADFLDETLARWAVARADALLAELEK